jgi:hypothetical protein
MRSILKHNLNLTIAYRILLFSRLHVSASRKYYLSIINVFSFQRAHFIEK